MNKFKKTVEGLSKKTQSDESRKKHTCSITGVKYEGYGNNAYPFPGRCCDNANMNYVIPARIMGFTPEIIKELGIKKVKLGIVAWGNKVGYNFI